MKKTVIALMVFALAAASASAGSLISRYSFNETSGTTVSDSVSGLNGTLQGAAVFNGTDSAVLNGTSGTYVALNPASLSGLGAVTLDAWFTYSVPNDNVHLFSIDNGGGTGSGGSYLRLNVYDSRETGPFIESIVGWGGSKTVDDVHLAQGQEIHVTVVYDGVNHYEALYVDGALAFELAGDASSVPALSGIPMNVFTLGRSPWVGYGDPMLVGSINEFRVFDGALTAGDIQSYDAMGPDAIPDPYPGQTDVDIAKVLSWPVPSDPNFDPAYTITYDIYVDPNAAKVAAASGSCAYQSLGQTAATFDPTPDLSYSTPYYWAVNAHVKFDYKSEPNVLSGSVWNFTTIAEEPSVNPVSPALTVVDAGEPSVVLSVTGTNIMSYQWYKEGVGALSNGTDYAGVDTATLTIYDVQLADEGYYYCEVTNLVGTDVSEPGLVMTRRLIIHYPLDTTSIVDGNEVTPDIVGGFDMTLVSGAVQGTGDGTDFPTLVTNDPNVKIGTGAMLFNNSNSADPNNAWGQYTTAGDVDMEAMGDGLTVSFWAQWIGNNTQWQGIINRENSWNAADMMWRVDKDPTSGVISLGRNGAVQAETTLIQNQWNFITFTVSSTGVVKAYNNGELISTVTGFSYGSGVNSSFKLGSADGGAGFFWGIVDDVKIYNYARTTEQVANDYLDVVGGWVCNNEGTVDLTYDFNDNCLVDLADFAMFAADWLNSNRIVAP